MDSSSIGIIVALVLLVIVSAYFSATETAFSSLNKIRLRNMADDGNRKAEATLRLAEDFDRLLSTLLVGNNIVNITAATLGTLFFTKLSPEYGATISTVVLTLVILTFGEISPKTIAKEHAEGWAMTATPLLRVLSVILRPLTILFSLLQKLVGSLFHTDGDRGITEDELITMVSTAEDEGGLDQNERELLEHCIVQMETENGLDRNASLADMRYTFIEQVTADAVVKCHESKEHKRSVAWDRVLTGKYTALPVFFGVMLLIFWLTFEVIGQGLSDLLALGIDYVTAGVDGALTAYGINPVVHSLIIDGIFAGVGSVLSFLPIIVTLFFFLSILEDTGYMARVAFVMDKLLRKIGLSGRSIVPLLIGFGCSVPAIMATRTVSSDRDRKMTILLTPYMSCSAKIPIYGFFTAAFFTDHKALVMISLYVLGIVVGILAALVMKGTAFRGKPVPFVMELPNYRMPSAKSVGLLLWEKAKDFLQRAFTVIFLATVVIWFLQSFDTRLNVVTDSADSLLALIGQWLAVLFRPLGFGDWRCATALISGFIAKESVVSTLQVLLGNAAITSLFTTRSAISFLVFTLLYTPCIAAVATIRRELGSRIKTVGVVLLQCVVAWLAAYIAYAVGGLLL